jgi:hypothetical protein
VQLAVHHLLQFVAAASAETMRCVFLDLLVVCWVVISSTLSGYATGSGNVVGIMHVPLKEIANFGRHFCLAGAAPAFNASPGDLT